MTKRKRYKSRDTSLRIRTRLSIDEYDQFIEEAKAENLKPTVFLRRRALTVHIELVQSKNHNRSHIEELKVMGQSLGDLAHETSKSEQSTDSPEEILKSINIFLENYQSKLSKFSSARILKDPDDGQSQPIIARVTSDQYKKIQIRFKRTGLPTLAEYLRQACIKEKITVVSNMTENFEMTNQLNRIAIHLRKLRQAAEKSGTEMTYLDTAFQNVTEILSYRQG